MENSDLKQVIKNLESKVYQKNKDIYHLKLCTLMMGFIIIFIYFQYETEKKQKEIILIDQKTEIVKNEIEKYNAEIKK